VSAAFAAAALATVTVASADREPALSTVVAGPAATPPVLPGDVFNYTSTSTSTITSVGEPPLTTNTTDNFTIRASAPFTFNKHSGLTRLAYVHSAGVTVTEDTYVGSVPHGGVNEEVAYGDTYTTKIVNPAGTIAGSGTQTFAVGSILSLYPEAAGQHWSPAATSTIVGKVSGTDLSGASNDIDYVDGSYSNDTSETVFGLKIATVETLLSNGTGKSVTTSSVLNPKTTLVALPKPAKSGFAIPVTTSGGNALPNPPVPAKTVDVPDWYPSRDKPSDPLLQSEIVDLGLVTTPAACGIRAGLKAFDLHGTSAQLDPLAAAYTTSVQDEYDVSGLGPVCTIENLVSHSYSEAGATAGKVSGTVVSKTVVILKSESGPKPLSAFANGGPFSLGFTFLDRLQKPAR
jgi:hypothetical protein